MKFEIGQTASVSRAFSQEEVNVFSALSLDDNPIHSDREYAAATPFGRCIVQGPLVASLIGGVLGSVLPGPGTVYIQQLSRFLKPAFIDEVLTASVQVVSVRADKPIITLRTWVEKADGELVIDGEAVVKFAPPA